ncbi:SGNH/GDSL hydrolase family protein [Pedobacter sp. MC2016-15]|uniref:SGNH/GDSL hydrolase family protein n=1 Tax=Pedobacter sp. MC2016-15 TaxID=2994473 RepID=UPI0022457280|nr:SGNH/GDSL hydrolase family protein [Pedobacter sp. MC2016-15]MCX2478760.1 SGNH/GDSL hydrolase family protein [Pedobacter sp. MC2016-15]
MKKLLKSILYLTICCFAVSFLAMKVKPKKIIFFGDSITQQGVKPGGYVDLIKKSLDSSKYEVIGAGIGGNKIYDLYLRLEDDVLHKKPDLVVIYIGVNDVWHKQTSHTGTDLDKFVKFYQALIAKIQSGNAKVILCTPAVIGEKKGGRNEMDAELDKYSAAIRELAQKNKLPLVDLRDQFVAFDLANNPDDLEKGVLTTDGVHLNPKGNKAVADVLLPLLK